MSSPLSTDQYGNSEDVTKGVSVVARPQIIEHVHTKQSSQSINIPALPTDPFYVFPRTTVVLSIYEVSDHAVVADMLVKHLQNNLKYVEVHAKQEKARIRGKSSTGGVMKIKMHLTANKSLQLAFVRDWGDSVEFMRDYASCVLMLQGNMPKCAITGCEGWKNMDLSDFSCPSDTE